MLRKSGSTHLLFFTVLTSLLTAGAACSSGSRVDLHKALQANLHETGAGNEPMLIAAYQPWFGRPNHLNVGYSSQDRVVLQRQIAEAQQLGIRAFVVNWYGRRDQFEDRSYSLLQQLAGGTGFKTAVMYDENDRDPGSTTETTISDLRYAYERYISPQAPDRENYLRFNGRPMIFIFPKSNRTDWNRVRQVTNSWEDPPLLIYEDINQRFANDFDGFFAWVHPGKEGWTRDGSNWGEGYLENFYKAMNNRYPDKIPIGAAWPGFNDSKASWSRNRRMDARCGKTFEDSLKLFRRFYSPEHPLPFLMIVTWNDYEEGTAIEKGYANCGRNQASPYNTFGTQ